MNITAIATVGLAIGMPLLGQELAAPAPIGQRAADVATADFDARVGSCGVGQADGQPMLFATIGRMPLEGAAAVGRLKGGHVQKGRERGMRGVAFTVAEPSDGGIPVVRFADAGGDAAARHAINTKGTGATNGRACDAASAMLSSVASCSVSGDPAAPDLTFAIPLSAFGTAKTGHVTLMKRGEGAMRAIATFSDGSSADVTAACTSGGGFKSNYDLAVAKK